jgi:hypothetical protein
VFILQTDAKSIQCFQKHAKLIENRFSRSKVRLEYGNFSQDSGMPGTEGVIAFSQLAVKGLKKIIMIIGMMFQVDASSRRPRAGEA